MSTASSPPAPGTLRLVRKFAAPPERVFHCWSTPDMLARWAWGTISRDVQCEVDLRVGGSYRISTARPDGPRWTYSGVYREIEPDRRLVYTACWDAPMGYESPEELITVQFQPHDDGHTEVIFDHAGVPIEEGRRRHAEGWNDTFDVLESVL